MKAVKHLTITQVRNLRKLGDPGADHMAIAWSCDVSPEEAREFFDTAPAGEVMRVLQEVFDLSGLSEGAQFPGAAADDAEPAQADVGDEQFPVLPGDPVGEDSRGA